MSRDAVPGQSRNAALVTGLALLGMTVLGIYSELLTLQRLHVPGDAPATAGNVLASLPAFRRAVLALWGVLLLDVVVAWGLYELLVPVNRGLSLLTAWLRLVYASILGVALARLIELLTLIDDVLPPADPLASEVATSALVHLDAYYAIWGAGLILFGAHLTALGVLVLRSAYVPRLMGAILLLAGLGYMAEYAATLLWPSFSLSLSSAGWAEPVFMLWLLWAGLKGRRVTRGPAV